jgi:hypothetical protein
VAERHLLVPNFKLKFCIAMAGLFQACHFFVSHLDVADVPVQPPQTIFRFDTALHQFLCARPFHFRIQYSVEPISGQ